MSARRFEFYTTAEHRAYLATADRSIDSQADRITSARRVAPDYPKLTPMAEWWAKHGHAQRQPVTPKRRSTR